eukprot:jgi/Ulvmu1/9766/UM056_0006.1
MYGRGSNCYVRIMPKRGPSAKDSFVEVGLQLYFCRSCGGESHKGDGNLAKHLTRKCHKKRVAEGGALYTYEAPLSKRARVQPPDDDGVLQGGAGPSKQDNDQDQAHSPPAAPMASPTSAPAPAPAPELPVLRPPSKTLLSQLREKTKQVVLPDETPESPGNGGPCTADTIDVESPSDEEDIVGAEYAALEKENWLAHATASLPLEPDFRPRGGSDGSSDHANLQAAFEKKILIDGMPTDEPFSAELQDAMRCAIAKQLNKDTPSPRKGTVRWCIANHDQPLAPGSNMPLLQACYTTLWLKEYAGINCRGVDALCRLLAIGGMLGTGNIMQGWELGEVLFGRNGKCDKEAILPILMSDDKNRIRSEGAADVTRKVHQENKLPEEAFLPSQSEQDINTHPQRQLTARCKMSARKRHRPCNEPHKDLGSHGVNAFQSSGIPGYECMQHTRILSVALKLVLARKHARMREEISSLLRALDRACALPACMLDDFRLQQRHQHPLM